MPSQIQPSPTVSRKLAYQKKQQRERAINDDDDPFNGSDAKEDAVKTLESDLNLLKMKLAEELDFDLDVSKTHYKLFDQEILAEVTGRRGEELDVKEDIDDNDDCEPIVKPGIEEARKAIGILKEFNFLHDSGRI